LFGQVCLGGDRPHDESIGSRWRPFQYGHGVSGHAFVGAVPFITAAQMAENPWLKGGLYCLSVLPGWSRIEHDKHYLSQVGLGWWLAYLACSAVDTTGQPARPYAVAPVITPEFVGVNVVFQR